MFDAMSTCCCFLFILSFLEIELIGIKAIDGNVDG